LIVGDRALSSEADEESYSLSAVLEPHKQRTITIDSIVISELADITLHHVDVVHALFRRELPVFIASGISSTRRRLLLLQRRLLPHAGRFG